MSFDLEVEVVAAEAHAKPWLNLAAYWSSLNESTRNRSAPVTVLHLGALLANCDDLTRRAGGLPIRVASKSIRSRGVLEAVLRMPGFRGVLAYTLAEALWLSENICDIVVGYPTTDAAALRELACNEQAAQNVTLMIDSVEQLDLIDAILPATSRCEIRVCLDLDASWRTRVLGHVGVLRSPIHDAVELKLLAQIITDRPGFVLVGVMSYEAQIAGIGDNPRGRPVAAALMRVVQHASSAELLQRRSACIAAVQEFAELEFVNGGGTGSLEQTAADPAITEVAAGSGLYGPHLFDHYRSFTPAPALGFALDVVRKPNPTTATVLGGGWVASGSPGQDRLPQIVWPAGLTYAPREGAGEVQTPLRGAAAVQLTVGDRVWFRHTKAGEVMEHTNNVIPVVAGKAGDPLLSYRGEGKSFL